jgi:hypothetical protein
MATEAVARGHEISCHGDRWESPAHLEEAAERAMIARAVAALERIGGVRPRGWHSRSAPSVHTRRLVVEHGGFLYDSNAYHDDLPYVVDVAGTQHVVVPYSFDTNDRRFSQAETFRLAADCSTSLLDAFDWLWREGERWPRLRSVGLHLRSIGRPGTHRRSGAVPRPPPPAQGRRVDRPAGRYRAALAETHGIAAAGGMTTGRAHPVDRVRKHRCPRGRSACRPGLHSRVFLLQVVEVSRVILLLLLCKDLDILVWFTLVPAEQEEVGFPRALSIRDNDFRRDCRRHEHSPLGV